MDKTIQQQLKDAELSIAEAEKEFGPDHLELAERLQKYANLLREVDGRKLDVVNIEARAKAIRAKQYAKEEEQENLKISTVVVKPKLAAPTPPGLYAGLVGMVIAACGFFVDHNLLPLISLLAAIFVVFDVVTTRGAGWWRTLLAVVFMASAYSCAQSVPDYMLTDASPIERFNYSTENPRLVENVRKLTESTKVKSYSFLLPQDYSSLDFDKKDWGDSFQWSTPERADGTKGVFRLLTMEPRAVSKGGSKFSLARLATEGVMPIVAQELELDDLTQTKPKTEEINGFYFATIEFGGRADNRNKKGIAYVAKERNSVLVLVGADFEEDAAQTMPQMEAIVYTFNRSGSPAPQQGAEAPAEAPAETPAENSGQAPATAPENAPTDSPSNSTDTQ